MKTVATLLAAWTLPLIIFSQEYEGVEMSSFEFPGIDNDLTKVTWVHAVNSHAQVKAALAGDVMFLEADVSIGQLVEGPSIVNMTPIMAHPPNTTSDLSLEQFLRLTLQSDKHVKLDFKSRLALSESEDMIAQALIKYNYGHRIWLNADIIPGPINCDKPVVDANYFLETCVDKFPNAVISAGWSTCYSSTQFNGSYTPKQIDDMTDALNSVLVLGAVTFSVRAGLAAQSIPLLDNLMKTTTDTSLTIWSAPGDPVNVTKLSELIETVGRVRVFTDLPPKLQAKLKESSVRSVHHEVRGKESSPPSSGNHLTATSALSLLLLGLSVIL